MSFWFVLIAPFVGSFLGLVAVRLPGGQPVVAGRSKCPSCHVTLRILDLIPVVGWLVLRGRCHACAARISRLYPAIELAALAVAAWAATQTSGVVLAASCFLGWALLVLAAIDLEHFLLPDILTLPLIPAGLAVTFVVNQGATTNHLIGAVVGFAVLIAVNAAYRQVRGHDGLGLGDAKLFAGAGAWVGWTGLPSVMLLGAASALLVALIGAIRGKGLAADQKIGFGAYLGLGLWIVWMHGPLI